MIWEARSLIGLFLSRSSNRLPCGRAREQEAKISRSDGVVLIDVEIYF